MWPDGDRKLSLIDGRNRLDALALLDRIGVDESGCLILKDVGPNDRRQFECAHQSPDPYALALSLNVHRRHLTAEQKRDLIAKLVKAKPDISDRQLGKMAKASKNTVAAVRTDLVSRGQVDHVEKRKDTKGRKQPARKAGKTFKQKLIEAAPLAKNPALLSAAIEADAEADAEATAKKRKAVYAVLDYSTFPDTVASADATETTEEDPRGFIVAVIKNATEKANIATRNLDHNFGMRDLEEIIQAIDTLTKKWDGVKRKLLAALKLVSDDTAEASAENYASMGDKS
jgi:hypothetical protein